LIVIKSSNPRAFPMLLEPTNRSAGSDPRAGTPPSVLNHNELLLGVSLYYLTRTFVSSVYMYAQNTAGFKTKYTKANTDAPLLFSAFKYNVAFWPPAKVAQIGNLALYSSEYLSALNATV
jgi:hypothetical protein